MARVAAGSIVFHSRGRFGPSVLGIEARYIPRPFCLCLGSRAGYLSSMLLSPLTWEHTSSSSLEAPARKQKRQKCEAKMIHLALPCSFCVAKLASGSIYLPFYLRSRIYKTPRYDLDESPILESSSSSPSSLCHYSLFRLISNILRHDHLLRHPRCRQLLLPSESRSPAKRRPRMRHLWLHRAAHDQTIPPLWWLCTSPFALCLSRSELNVP
jgi:hypothetical protein